MSPPGPRRSDSRGARLLLGLLFLGLAGFWAFTALRSRSTGEHVEVRVLVLDLAGAPVSGALVRSRYGGAWTPCNTRGEALLVDPRVRTGLDGRAAALEDALEARASFHALRRGRRAEVREAPDGTLEARLALEPCGMLRIGVAPSGYEDAHATVDPDPVRERWRLVEGRDVIRAGEAATYAVFAGATSLWVTLEGARGVAQVRLELDAPGPGLLLERSLGPEAARPIRGRVELPPGARAPTLAGRLEVLELRPPREPIPRSAVHIADDGSFLVDYVGAGRFELSAHVPFAEVRLPVGAEAGDDAVRIAAAPRPWIELGPPDLARLHPPPRVSLFAEGLSEDLLPAGGALAVERGVAVAAPGAGTYQVVLALRGSDEGPPRSGAAVVTLGAAGSTRAEVVLADLPHGRLGLKVAGLPERGGEAHLLPDRVRTLLGGLASEVEFAHVAVGPTLLSVVWRDPDLAAEWLAAEVRAGETTTLDIVPARGARVRLDVSATAAAQDARTWTLRWSPDDTPYGSAQGRLELVREGVSPVLATRTALKPGRYRVTLQPAEPGPVPSLGVAFDLAAGEPRLVKVSAP